jgi:AraC-like DNA-binding protein
MFTLVQLVQLMTVIIALGGIVFALRQGSRQPLIWIWCVFCLGLGGVAITDAFEGQLGVFGELLSLASIVTCGFSWLLARALFRPAPAFDWKHLTLVAIVAATYMFDRYLPNFVSPETLASDAMVTGLRSLDNFQILMVSVFLVFSVVEVFKGWDKALPVLEQRYRIAYVAVYAITFTLTIIWLRQSPDFVLQNPWTEIITPLCAMSVLIYAGIFFRHRLANPVGVVGANDNLVADASEPKPVALPPTEEEIALAKTIEAYVKANDCYLTTNLKVSRLARLLMEPEYKITRAITGVLGFKNFNQYINQYRIEHAKSLFCDDKFDDVSILAIGMESGFGSVGPFNRAFKNHAGVTPREFRAMARS